METNQIEIDVTELIANFVSTGIEIDMAEASDRPDNIVAINIRGYSKTTQTSDNASATSQKDKNIVTMSNGPAPNDQTTTVTAKTAATSPPLIIDTHHPHRYGSPILPLLPLRTLDYQVPKRYGANSTHNTTVRTIISATGIPLHGDPFITHRHRARQQLGKDTFTLVILSDSSSKSEWAAAIAAVNEYFASARLTMPIEIIDHRILKGLYTLPTLANDPLTKYIAKKKGVIRKVLERAGVDWASLEFWYRGVGKTREESEATVLIGTTEADKMEKEKLWWGKGEVAEKVKEKGKGKMGVEVCWRE